MDERLQGSGNGQQGGGPALHDALNASKLAAFGPQAHALLARHMENHVQTGIVAERQQRADALATALAPIVEKSSDLKSTSNHNSTRNYHVETLEAGKPHETKVHGSLDTLNRDLRVAVEHVTGNKYLEEGPIATRLGAALPETDEEGRFAIPEDPEHPLYQAVLSGIRVSLGLETSAGNGESTRTSAPMGTILDPETVLVKSTEAGEDSPALYQLVGPNDERFTAVMDTTKHVAQQLSESDHRLFSSTS